MYTSTKQNCIDYRSEIFEELEQLITFSDSPSSQPELNYHDVGLNSSEIDEYWLSKEPAQLDASFIQQVAHEADSQSNVHIDRSGISQSKKKVAKERIEKTYGITRQVLEQQYFGMTLEQAAKHLNVSKSTLKRMSRTCDIPRWPHHKTRKVDGHVNQGISLPVVADHLVHNMKNMSTVVDGRLLDNNDQVPIAPPRATDLVASLLNDLHIAREQNDALHTEIETMRTNLAESLGEVARLKEQLLQQQQE
ncbi:protein NLP3 [Solanum lycopersicum]